MARPTKPNSANSRSNNVGNLELTFEVRKDQIGNIRGEVRFRRITELEAENSEIILEAIQLRAVYM